MFAALNIIGLYHDSIVKKAADQLPDHKKPRLSAHSRYTSYWLQHSKTYATCARLLTVLGYSELVIEMLGRKKLSRDRKWRLIILLEATKYVCCHPSKTKLTHPQGGSPSRDLSKHLLPANSGTRPASKRNRSRCHSTNTRRAGLRAAP